MTQQIKNRYIDLVTKKQKEELLEVFGQAFHEVVPPLLDDLKEDITNDLGGRIDAIDRKLFNITDSHARKLDNHEHRIEKLEKRPQPLAY